MDNKASFHDKNSEEALLNQYISDIAGCKPLSQEEEQKLSALILAGNGRAKDKLVSANLMFVVSIARQYKTDGVDMMDLINEGNIALIKAAGKYDASKGKRFTQYAVWDIKKAIEAYLPKEEMRMNRTATEHIASKGGEADKTASEFTANEQMIKAIAMLPEREQMVLNAYFGIETEQLTMAEIGEAMGLKRERVRQIRNRALRRLHSFRNII